jgi:hypothetical protein
VLHMSYGQRSASAQQGNNTAAKLCSCEAGAAQERLRQGMLQHLQPCSPQAWALA